MGGGFVQVRGALGAPLENLFDDVQSAKAQFERKHCQPPKPRHTIKHYADGSVVVDSVEQDEQGRPLRCAFVSRSYGDLAWTERGDATGRGHTTEEAIRDAIRYVETGE